MRAASSAQSCTTSQQPSSALRTVGAVKLADYLELTKPKIAVLALLTVTVGYTLGCGGNWQLVRLLHALFGISLVAGASSALNQFLERETDARMKRTSARPLPAGRLVPGEVLLFGVTTGIAGSLYLATWVNTLTALLALATLLLYVGVYTPLKAKTSLCTAVGAIPGALPPVLGWTAAGGQLDAGAFSLFAILFLWQFPHFLAIAWLYREEYAGAGLRMLPAARPAPRVTGLMAVAYASALIPVSMLPSQFALAGDSYLTAALILGLGYLVCAIRFMRHESVRMARDLLWSSLLYLPVLLIILTWNHLQLIN